VPALGIAWVGDAFTYAEQYTQQRKVGNEGRNNRRARSRSPAGNT